MIGVAAVLCRRRLAAGAGGGARAWPVVDRDRPVVLAERNLMATTAGQSVLSVALLQDVAAIPILALVPLLALGPGRPAATTARGWLGAAKAVGVIAAIVLGGRLLLRPALRWIARSARPRSSPPRRCCWWWPPRR